MRFKISVVSIVLVCSALLSTGQKIKYKDLFPILNEKNYEEGGPQLIAYLAALKKDEANPNLQMGLMLEHQFLAYDIIDDSSKIYTSGDSAILFLEKAKTLITEKELKKNDEYYQAFFRRDLRTGEFGIKVSDVHLDIEKKVEVIGQRINDVKTINRSLSQIEAKYAQALEKFTTISTNHEDYNSFLLSVSSDEQTELTNIQTLASDANEKAKSIQKIAEKLGSAKYQQEIELKPIDDFRKDGLQSSDLLSGTISIWDYETWSREALSEIRGGVGLFKALITNYYKEIREKKSKLKRSQNADGLEMPDELAKTFDKYEQESTVKKLLQVETYEAKVMKNVDLQLNQDLMDSSKIGSQLEIYTSAMENVNVLYSLVNEITIEGLADAKKKYPEYIDSFFKTHGTASKYVEEMKDWSARNKEWITNSVEYWTERNKWGIIAKEGEAERKIALFMTDSLYGDFKILRVNQFTIPQVVVYGVDIKTKKGHVRSFGEDRIEQWAVEFDLPESDGLLYETDTIPSTESATSFYIYNGNMEENNLSAVCYTDSGTKEWAVNVTVSKKPVDFKFDDLTQELTILMYPEEQLPLDSDELGYIVIDRTGNVR